MRERYAMKTWDTIEKGIQYLREIALVEMLYDPNFAPNDPHQNHDRHLFKRQWKNIDLPIQLKFFVVGFWFGYFFFFATLVKSKPPPKQVSALSSKSMQRFITSIISYSSCHTLSGCEL